MEKTSSFMPNKPLKVSITFPLIGKTKTSMQEECNINNIMAKYLSTGLTEFVNNRSPQYGDASGLDFRTAMQTVAKTTELFSEMPANVRKDFNNSPGEFLDYVNDPQNREEAIKRGLIPSGDRRAPEPRTDRTRGSDTPSAAAPPAVATPPTAPPET